MELLERVADKLAQETLKIVEQTGNEDLVDEIKKTIGSSSTTLEEAYLTAVRIRRAEARALTILVQHQQELAKSRT